MHLVIRNRADVSASMIQPASGLCQHSKADISGSCDIKPESDDWDTGKIEIQITRIVLQVIVGAISKINTSQTTVIFWVRFRMKVCAIVSAYSGHGNSLYNVLRA